MNDVHESMQNDDRDTLLQGRSRARLQIIEGLGELELCLGFVLAELDRSALVLKAREKIKQLIQKAEICFFALKFGNPSIFRVSGITIMLICLFLWIFIGNNLLLALLSNFF